jgi:hypothetical protein
MIEENRIIHGLWVGEKLSEIELLTLKSFTGFGHEFHLWVYEKIKNKLPKNVILQDANEIIPQKKVFRRKYNDPEAKIGKGSLGAPFSDIFRYKLLYEKGGWWVDMDVTCLKPIDFQGDYFFRSHPLLPMVGNIMKVPKGCELMRLSYEESDRTCDENTLEWLKTNQILNKHIKLLGLEQFIYSDYVNLDWWQTTEPFIFQKQSIPLDWYFIHWMNEEWRMQGISKNRFYRNTRLFELFTKNSLSVKSYPISSNSFANKVLRRFQQIKLR